MPSLEPSPHPTELAGGRYSIRQLLGIGARKRVYLAHDRDLDREVAISLLRLDVLDARAPQRILEEARAMARLGGHPRIVTIHDVGEERGQPFIVSQYMAGGTLAERLRQSPDARLPPEEALRLADQLCQALEHAHAHGIVHRDLKPSNVWLDADGFAKLGDFGLAASLDQGKTDAEGRIVGTLAYLPPEQILGQPLDPRSDLYALGAILYEMLTGRRPFESDTTAALLSQHLNTVPDAPSEHAAAISGALDALVLALLAKSPDERPANAGVVRASLGAIMTTPEPVGGKPALVPPSRGPFVGRDQEIERLRRSLDDAVVGRGRIVLLSGDPGIGKTRTTERFADEARARTVTVLVGRCHEGDGAPAYWPWVQILRAWIAEHPSEDPGQSLRFDAPEILQLVPELRGDDAATPSPAANLDAARFRMFDAITTFFRRTSRHRPLVVLLDDLHWADRSSLLLFQFLAREIADSSLCLIATYREAEIAQGHPLAQILPGLRPPTCERIALRGLGERHVRDLVTELGGEPVPEAFVQKIFRETEGNPFFVQEVLRHLVEEGILFRDGSGWRSSVPPEDIGLPESIREVVGRRLARLSEPCRRWLAVAAVIGREFDVRVLERAVDAKTDVMLGALEEAEAARVVAELPRSISRYAFTHALVRETLYSEIGTTQRVRLHRKIGEVLEALYASKPEPHLAAIAHHYFAAAPLGDAMRAVDFSTRAGDVAVAQLAYEEAAVHYRHALRAAEIGAGLDAAGRCDVLLKLGEAQWSAADFNDSKDSFKRAADLAVTPEQKAYSALGYGGLHPAFDLGVVDQRLIDLLQRALAALPKTDSALRARVMVRLAEKLAYVPEHGPVAASAMAHEAAEMARRVGDRASLASVLASLQFVVWRADNLESRLAWTREITSLAESVGDYRLASLGHLWRASQSIESGDLDGAAPAFAALEQCAQAIRQPYIQWIAATTNAMRAAIAGRFAEAETLAGQALGFGEERENKNAGQLFGAQLLFLRWDQGRLDELVAGIAALTDELPSLTVWRAAYAWVLAELGRSSEAAAELAVLDRAPNGGVASDQFELVSFWLLAGAVCRTSERTRAPALYDRLLPFASRCVISGGCVFTGSAALSLGELAAMLGRFADAERHFRDALAVHERMGARPFVARTRYELAAMLLRRGQPGDREEANRLLRQALDEAQRLGMKAVVERAIALEIAAEGIAEKDTGSSIDSVSASVEARKPDLAAKAAPDGIVTLLFSDMEGFSAMTERLGDEQAYRVTKLHNTLIRAAIAAHGGFEVENQGDGFMVAFSSAGRGLRCAVEIQKRFAAQARTHGGPPILVRIGLHTGEPIREGDRFFGRTVILAARIAARARGGEILVSSVFRHLVEQTEDAAFGPIEEVELKGLSGRHGICPVLWGEPVRSSTAAPEPTTADPEPLGIEAPPDNVFRKESDYWHVSYGGKSVRLIDLKGMHDLANLLRHPGRELHVSELVALGREPAVTAESAPVERLRKAVSARIRESLSHIRKEHVELGRHLTNAVRTGAHCSYLPEKPTVWRI